MIPAYKEEAKFKKLIENDQPVPLRDSIAMMERQILQLRESVNYLQRENSRLKSDIQTLASAINRN